MINVSFLGQDLRGTTIRNNERYEVIDFGDLAGLMISTTKLYAKESTKGHSHNEADEVYIFQSGWGIMLIEGTVRDVGPGDVVLIPRGAYHRVLNRNNVEAVCFISVFQKYEGRGK